MLYHNLLFSCWNILVRRKLSLKILFDAKLENEIFVFGTSTRKMANNFTFLRYSNSIRTYLLCSLFICDTWVFLHLLLSTSFCLHDNLERKKEHQFRLRIPCMKNNASRKILAVAVFVRERDDRKFFTRIIWNRNQCERK